MVFIASDEKMRMVDDVELQPEAFQTAAANHTRKHREITAVLLLSFPVIAAIIILRGTLGEDLSELCFSASLKSFAVCLQIFWPDIT